MLPVNAQHGGIPFTPDSLPMEQKQRRRPPRNHRSGKTRGPLDPAAAKEKAERDFEKEIEMRLHYFIDSNEQELELEPMNSFRRRLVHNVAKTFNMETESRGEEPTRYVALIKTGDSAAPSADSETSAAPNSKTDETALPNRKAEEPAAPRGRAPRTWDFGNQTFPIDPGKDGVRLALKIDGSLEVWRESEQKYILFDCVVTAREVRVRQGKILQPGDSGW